MDTCHKRSTQETSLGLGLGLGLNLNCINDCIFTFDEEYENPTIFTKCIPKPRENFDLGELDHDTFLKPSNLFFNRMLRS